ncbi:NADPH:quinone reductase-like Zn-dependent oxidoreductase [Bradyrhizobium japonicum]|jgi:NADPH:quinone reductase-like Zn-dependent oxidoreductase|uniref:zinc-dependent alcohol dehydrogenase family protein n=1 Tax=Bradyrhizobium TaxID=374 RepID=UPI0004B52250|nr:MULTISPECIES: zinc-dependent alcohol dehydrogenase family protein [Bradyrhizobium]MBR0880691.1 zinc-dependent alcohol dehydrogenase family protein [Bradyrhizobium liaoningense]MBR0943815.1 zinc-dependent alcohol dehydrogenase family protein [Bradyrhizobium liaoningense]MBR1000731.1 zinc-dependent alcohol dehydrogenase family protein [Bradyrhizobium liaoningense]MBR1027993.1 zinc-dependent alcohol dehydrogenase family protein [Bradyrhizobium liaoningense]MBR1066770.1 zinc-dependent alcohol d
MARVVRFHEYGDADVLKIEDVDVAAPDADEVQIEVRAIGLNRAEVMFRRNAYVQQTQLPSRLGYEAAGVVKTVGASVRDFRPGQSVSVIPTEDMARWGTYGEVINIPARHLVVHPQNLTFEQAAASWMKYVTAWGALIEQAKLKADDYLVVTAASSSVGTAAFQIARAVGATVIATTRTSAKSKALLDAGAHHVVATAEEDLVARVMEITSGKGARVIFDPIGGPAIEQLTQVMSHRGILLEYGALSPDIGAFPQFAVLGKSLTIKGYLYNEVVHDDAALARAKAFILEGLSSGKLKPLISRSFKFEQIQEATRFLESNEQIGKIVVTV